MSCNFSNVYSVLLKRHIDDGGGHSGWKTVAAVYTRWSVGLTDPFLYCFFANDSLHHRITDRVHQRDGASVRASLTASLSLRPSTSLCFPQIPPHNYHIFTRTPMYSHKFPTWSFIFSYNSPSNDQNPMNRGSKGWKLYYALRTGLCHPRRGPLV